MKNNALPKFSTRRVEGTANVELCSVVAREEYEKKTIAELEAKLQSADMDPSDYVGEMMKVRLGIGGPSGGDHRAMKVSDFFGKIDEDSSGSLTKQELKESFEKLKIQLSDEQFESFYSAFDPNGDGKIDYMEFLAQMRTHVHGSEGIVKRESHIDRKKSKKGKKTLLKALLKAVTVPSIVRDYL